MAHMLGPLPGYLYSKGAFYDTLFVQNCETCAYVFRYHTILKNTNLNYHRLTDSSQHCPDPFLEMCNFVGVKDYLFVDLIVQLLQYPVLFLFFFF